MCRMKLKFLSSKSGYRSSSSPFEMALTLGHHREYTLGDGGGSIYVHL